MPKKASGGGFNSKHPRDSHGRFAAAVGAAVSKVKSLFGGGKKKAAVSAKSTRKGASSADVARNRRRRETAKATAARVAPLNARRARSKVPIGKKTGPAAELQQKRVAANSARRAKQAADAREMARINATATARRQAAAFTRMHGFSRGMRVRPVTNYSD